MRIYTGKQLIKLLPEEIKEKFIRNAKQQLKMNSEDLEKYLENTFSNLGSLIDSALTWSHTPEGKDYWSNIFDEYRYVAIPEKNQICKFWNEDPKDICIGKVEAVIEDEEDQEIYFVSHGYFYKFASPILNTEIINYFKDGNSI